MENFSFLLERSFVELVDKRADARDWKKGEFAKMVWPDAPAKAAAAKWSAMFYARFIRLVSKYSDRPDDAGKLTRRLIDEMDHMWLFLKEAGVAPTNNHAERLLRFAVLWRKASFGTVSEKGGRFAERILSLRQTCRLRGKRIFPVLVDAMAKGLGDMAFAGAARCRRPPQ